MPCYRVLNFPLLVNERCVTKASLLAIVTLVLMAGLAASRGCFRLVGRFIVPAYRVIRYSSLLQT